MRIKNNEKTRTGNALLYAPLFFLATDRGLEKGVKDGVHACCIARCASGTRMGKRACDEGNTTIECCGFFRVKVDGRGEVWGLGWGRR